MSPMASRAQWVTVAGLWVYGIGLVFWTVRNGPISDALGSLGAATADIIDLVMIGALLRDGCIRGRRRQGWWAMLAVMTVDLAATVEWARLEATTLHPYGTIGDALYQLYYPLMTVACGLFFLSCGGTFRKRQTWLDATTVMLGVLTALWAILYEPLFEGGSGFSLSFATKFSYTLLISVTMTMTALLFTQIMDWREERAMMLIIGTALSGLVIDVMWLVLDVNGVAGATAVTNVGAVLYSALLASAVAAERLRPDAPEREPLREGNTYSFLPVLVLLLAIALFVGTETNRRGLDSRILVGFILLGAVVLVARQQGVRHELRRLIRMAVIREVEARLTELVRQSPDVFAVVNSRCMLEYVSPSAEPMLGMRAADLQNTFAASLLGVANEASVAAFLKRLESHSGASAEMEVSIVGAAGEPRILRVIGRNQLANALIDGITLTVRDVSEQRALEREVLDISTRERLRLCSGIHEGLSQDLTGIALLLQGTSTRTGSRSFLQQSLQDIGVHVRQAISTAQDLAAEISPLQVVRGSLSAALGKLAANLSGRHARVQFIATSVDCHIDEGVAENLYRIATEAMGNALRHSACTLVKVALRIGASELTLDITDNGSGFDPEPARRSGRGLRLMDYRTQIIGGVLQIDQPAAGGTRLVVTVPLREHASSSEGGQSVREY